MNLKELTKNKKCVIFDLDGTLVDSMWMWLTIDEIYLGKFGIECPPDLQKDIEGMGYTETAVYFKERFHIPDSIEQIKNDWYVMSCEKYRNEVPLKRGVKEYIDFCKEQGILLGVASSNSRELIDITLKANHVYDYFDCIFTSCDVKRGKPAPDVYLAVSEYLHVAPSDCLVFEDIVAGIQSGKNAGMTTVAVADDYSNYQWEEKKSVADYFIDDYLQ